MPSILDIAITSNGLAGKNRQDQLILRLHRDDCARFHEDRNLIERRYQAIVARGDHFLGVRWYTYGGLSEDDRLLYIVEMALDAAFVRKRFRPIELFNHVCRANEKALDLDKMLYPQLSTDRKSVIPLTEQEWVHPSQVISQYSYLARHGNGYVAPAENNLFFIPYFLYLAGDRAILAQHTSSLTNADTARVAFLDFEMDMRRLTDVHQRWVRKQVEQIEAAMVGGTRDEVSTTFVPSSATYRPLG